MTKVTDPAIGFVSDVEVKSLSEGFLQASAFADCSSDDEEGLEDAEWSDEAQAFAKDATRVWLSRISSDDFGSAISLTPPSQDMDNDVLRSIGANVYYEMCGHGAGFQDDPALEENGLAQRLADAARTFRIEGPYLGDDGLRHFSDEYSLYRRTISQADLIEQIVRRVLHDNEIIVPLTGEESLTSHFGQAFSGARVDYMIARPKLAEEFDTAAKASPDEAFTGQEAEASITSSIALIGMGVPRNVQRDVVDALEKEVADKVISPEAVNLFKAPPAGVLAFLKPDIVQSVMSPDRFPKPVAPKVQTEPAAPAPGL